MLLSPRCEVSISYTGDRATIRAVIGAWQSPQGKRPLAARMADLALRAQRLILLRRFDQLEALIRSQIPELRRVPGGLKAVAEAEAQLLAARTLLRQPVATVVDKKASRG